ncbi:MAG: hypothetical protein RML92_02765 [Bacteroidia bacterium]|nr:hypothetical protein [Bacteroidia bacterium]
MKEWLMGSDKLNTVVAVLLTIWLGLAVHLWRLTRRVEALEKKSEPPSDNQNILQQSA